MTLSDFAVYPRQADSLKHQIVRHLDAAPPIAIDGEVYALIVPDTNLLAGAPVAAEAYNLIKNSAIETVILIASAPNSTFQRINICGVNEYHTPLGTLSVNERMRQELCDEDDDIYLDDSGHFNLNGIDVQLPFLQTVLKTFNVVPIVMGYESPAFCHELGHAIGEITYNQRSLVVASADLLAASEANLAEFKTLFEAVDVSRLMALLNSERVHMQGKGPLLATLIAAQHRHINKARVLTATPADDATPGYLSAVIWR